jgi:Fur family ferric uptake transcriptional regulator
MSHHTQLVETLRRQGYRLTPQREMILIAIQDADGHLTAEEICARVQARYPYVNISTIYRNINFLKQLHLITETDLGQGRMQYELAVPEHHHHLVCQRCGEMWQVEHRFLKPLENALWREYGFRADMEHFAIFGTCGRCLKTEPKR